MEYRILGRTGIKVSAIGIGGEGFEKRSYDARLCRCRNDSLC
jgi:aryl-alcohol dehydrogenase-like predicted oxidoreductase